MARKWPAGVSQTSVFPALFVSRTQHFGRQLILVVRVNIFTNVFFDNFDADFVQLVGNLRRKFVGHAPAGRRAFCPRWEADIGIGQANRLHLLAGRKIDILKSNFYSLN